MFWHVDDRGTMVLMLTASGEETRTLTKDAVNRFIANVIGDLAATYFIDIVTDELRISFSKVRPEVKVTWRARVPKDDVDTLRRYMTLGSPDAPGQWPDDIHPSALD